MPTGLEKIRMLREADRRSLRRKILILIMVAVGMFVVMSCLRSTKIGFLTPWEAAGNIFAAIKLEAARIFHWDLYNQRAEVIAAHPHYYESLGNCKSAFVMLVMGAVLAMAGGIYQNVFRNPIATPSMLGISSGINMSNLILVIIYGYNAIEMVKWRYILGLAAAVGSLIFIFLVSRLMNRKKSSVTDMLLISTILMRLVRNFMSIYEYYILEDEQYLTLEEMNAYGTGIYDGTALYILFAIMLAALIIIILLRFSLNAISFTDDEAKTMGINAPAMRFLVLVCGTVLTTCVQITYGDVGMLALLAPHFCRRWVGCDFRYVLLGSAGIGAITMMLCRAIRYVLTFNYYLNLISMGTIINLAITPLAVIILVGQRREWNQNLG